MNKNSDMNKLIYMNKLIQNLLHSLSKCSCGRKPYIWQTENDNVIRYQVKCECGKHTNKYSTVLKAIEKWNGDKHDN